MLVLEASALQMRMDRRNLKKLSLLKGDENFFPRKKFGGGSLPYNNNGPCYARKTPPSSEQALNPPPLKGQELKQMFQTPPSLKTSF